MAQKDLIPINRRTKEEAKEISRRGGIASGKARRDKRTLRQIAEELLSMTMKDKDGKETKSPITGEAMSIAETIVTAQIKKAIGGDTKAFTELTDIKGEKVVKTEQRVDVNVSNDKRLANVPEDLLRKVAQHIKANDE